MPCKVPGGLGLGFRAVASGGEGFRLGGSGAASCAVCKGTGQCLNPVFIHGCDNE